MTEIAPLPAARPAGGALDLTVTATAAAEEAGTIASDFETFLRLLTTQMRNQDPLKPLESTEFVAQLATFSAVEQQVATNERLGAIETLLSGGAQNLAAWLGAEVEAPMPVQWDGAPVRIRFDADAAGTQATLVVRDAGGAEVHRRAIDPEEAELVWTGDGGEQGEIYRFEIERTTADGQSEVEIGRVFAPVTEARPGENGAILIAPGGVRVEEGAVTAVRGA